MAQIWADHGRDVMGDGGYSLTTRMTFFIQRYDASLLHRPQAVCEDA